MGNLAWVRTPLMLRNDRKTITTLFMHHFVMEVRMEPFRGDEQDAALLQGMAGALRQAEQDLHHSSGEEPAGLRPLRQRLPIGRRPLPGWVTGSRVLLGTGELN